MMRPCGIKIPYMISLNKWVRSRTPQDKFRREGGSKEGDRWRDVLGGVVVFLTHF